MTKERSPSLSKFLKILIDQLRSWPYLYQRSWEINSPSISCSLLSSPHTQFKLWIALRSISRQNLAKRLSRESWIECTSSIIQSPRPVPLENLIMKVSTRLSFGWTVRSMAHSKSRRISKTLIRAALILSIDQILISRVNSGIWRYSESKKME